MVWHITATSCHYQTRPAKLDDIIALKPVAHFLNGDCFYFAPGNANFWNMTTPDAAVSNVANDFLRKFQQGYYHSSYQALKAARDTAGLKLYWCPDDHGWGGSDWDHTVATANNGNNPVNATNLADVLTHWRAGLAGHNQIRATYFDNPPNGAANGDIPSAMVGTATAADYPVLYFSKDYGSNGVEGGNLIRVIFPDYVSYKTPIVATDNAAKTLLGLKQKAWLKDQWTDAKAKGFKHIIVISSKDLFNTMNDDGYKSYITEMNELLTFIQTNDLPVVYCTGDRHSPHIAMTRALNGDIADFFSICACPANHDGDPQTFYQQCIDLINTKGTDSSCWLKITVDEERKLTRFSIMFMYTGQEWRGYDIPWGSRIPT